MNNIAQKNNSNVIFYSYPFEEPETDLGANLTVECPDISSGNELVFLEEFLRILRTKLSNNKNAERFFNIDDFNSFEFITSVPLSLNENKILMPNLNQMLVPINDQQIRRKVEIACKEYFTFNNKQGLYIKRADKINLDSLYILMSMVPDVISNIIFECEVHPGFHEWSKTKLDETEKWRWRQLLSLMSPIINNSQYSVKPVEKSVKRDWQEVVNTEVKNLVSAYQQNDRVDFEKAVESILNASSLFEIPKNRKYILITAVCSFLIELGDSKRASKIMNKHINEAIQSLYGANTIEEVAASSMFLHVTAISYIQSGLNVESIDRTMKAMLELLAGNIKKQKLTSISALQIIQTIILERSIQSNQNMNYNTADLFLSILQFIFEEEDFEYQEILLDQQIKTKLMNKYSDNISLIVLTIYNYYKNFHDKYYLKKIRQFIKKNNSQIKIKQLLLVDDINEAIENKNEIQYHKLLKAFEKRYEISDLPDYTLLKASFAFSGNQKLKQKVLNYLENLEDKRMASIIAGTTPDLNMYTIFDISKHLLSKQFSNLAEPLLNILQERITGMNDVQLNDYIQSEIS